MKYKNRLFQLRGKESQRAFAEKLGMSQQNYANYESGKQGLKSDLIERICDTFGCSAEWLLCLDGKNHDLAGIPGAHPVRGVPMVKVPLVGRVHAGPAGDPDVYEEADEFIDIPQSYLDIDPECVAVDFEGDCMLPDFGDATSLIVSPNSPFGNGSIVIASIDGADYVVRRMEQNARELRLKASNKAYEDIVVSRDEEHEVEFKGKVLGCFRRFE